MPSPSGLLWASVLVGVLALAGQSLLLPFDLLHHGFITNSRDFLIYSDGARTALDGRPLYTTPVGEDGFFTYPPFAALCFTPFTVLSPAVGGLAWSVLCFLLLALVIGRTLRLTGLRPDARLVVTSLALAAAATALEPVRTTLWYGQINILLMTLIFLDLSRPERDDGAARGGRLRGVGVGLAAGIKLIPLIFLPYLLITRQWRTAATALATFTGTVAVSWVLLPKDSAQYWFHAVRDTSHIGELSHPANQSVNGFLARAWYPGHSPGWLWAILAAAVIALGLLLARSACARGEKTLALLLVGLTSCAASPFTWGHHWVWFAPFAAWLVGHSATAFAAKDRSWARWAAAAVVLGAWAFVWPWHKPPSTPEEPRVVPGLFYHVLDAGSPWYRHVASGWYVWAYAAILTGVAIWLRGPRSETDEQTAAGQGTAGAPA
jgi:alpha-1,2-mannosyltransferase